MPLTLRELLHEAAQSLHACAIEHPSLEAEILLAHVLGVSRSHLHAWPEKVPAVSASGAFTELIKRRCQGEPIAYLTGKREFWSLELEVTPATLIPRPETELLVDAALSVGDSLPPVIQVADLGTGSGAIALALASERPAWVISAVDASEEALTVARRNAEKFKLSTVSFYRGHWCDALPMKGYDIIVSNPPYISEAEWPDYAAELSKEPYRALVAGEDGLSDIREIGATAKQYLKSGGYLLIEHGFKQAVQVQAVFKAEGYLAVHSLRDLNGHERVTMGRKPLD
jgi:release factor glutamine methyltransferase